VWRFPTKPGPDHSDGKSGIGILPVVLADRLEAYPTASYAVVIRKIRVIRHKLLQTADRYVESTTEVQG
jgi:hypothetical protein